MRKKLGSVLSALFIIAGGVLLILYAAGVFKITPFKGWWTLFIIVPTLISMVSSRVNVGHFMVLAIAAVLLLNANGLLEGANIWLIIVGIVVITIGLGIVFKPRVKIPHIETGAQGEYNAVFSTIDTELIENDFHGFKASAVFGGIDIDLRGCTILSDAVIEASAVFGGIELHVPANICVKISGTPVMGGIDDETKHAVTTGPTLFINGSAVFGGISVNEEKKDA